MMRKFIFVLIVLSSSLLKINAQVTIGSGEAPNPNALLDLKESGTASTKGLLMPRVALSSTTLPNPMKEHVMGMMVFNTATVEDVTPGFYYNTGSKWIKAGENNDAPWLISETEKIATSSTDDIYHIGHVSIGQNQAVDPTAILDVEASDKGVLLPRITLTSATDKETIKNPTVGLLIYNTGENTTFKTTGYMFWDGDQWKLFTSASSESGRATLNCAGATMSPSQQIKGDTPIISGTILQIPYAASNGGSYNGAKLVSVGNPNVTATISGGILSTGNGVISFSLSGTPTLDQQAPNGLVFDLTPFLEANPDITGCDEVVVGNNLSASIDELAVMGYLAYGTDNDQIGANDTQVTGYSISCKSPDGKYSVRVFVPSGTTTIRRTSQQINIQVRNNQAEAQTVIWNFSTTWSAGLVADANMFTIPSRRWGGDNNGGSGWYNAITSGYGNYWGDRGIYDGNGPEYRRYTWIPLGPENNVSYEIYVMAALDTTTPNVYVTPTLLKVYIRFVQVTAAN